MQGKQSHSQLVCKINLFLILVKTNNLSSVGMISISEEENKMLPMGGSAAVRDKHLNVVPDQYLVQTSVSHQIHCLVSHAIYLSLS